MARAGLLLAVLLTSASVTLGAFAPKTGCTPLKCKRYEGFTIPDDSLDYSSPLTWQKSPQQWLAFYQGVFNGLWYGGGAPDYFSFKDWKTTDSARMPALSYEKYDLKSNSISYQDVKDYPDLASCCNGCRVTVNCSMFVYKPADFTAGAKVAGGRCGFIMAIEAGQGGDDDKYGPFNKNKDRIGSPFAGTARQQARSTEKLSFVGGFCNPYGPGLSDTGVILDDPHFTGAHGTRFDFNGELDKSFCLLTDSTLHINAVLKGYRSANTVGATVDKDGKGIRSWIKEVGVLWTDAEGKRHSLHLTARAGKDQARGSGFLATSRLDQAPFQAPSKAGERYTKGDLTFTFLGTTKKGPFDLDSYQVEIKGLLNMGLEMRVAHPLLQAPNDAEAHFNLMLNHVAVSEKVHGVLGQTYRETPSQRFKALQYSELSKLLGAPIQADGESGKGFLDGAVGDYLSSDVLVPDCRVSTYGAE